MQFTIRRLLLIFPAFLIGTIIAAVLDYGTLGSYRWTYAVSDVRRIHVDIEFYQESYPDKPVSCEVLNAWLSGNLPPNHPVAQMMGSHSRHDPWGNRYMCVRNPEVSGDAAAALGIYSTGRDGVSKSSGNDPDDLNSWNDRCALWYTRDTT